MTREELRRQLMENRKEIERVSHMIDYMHEQLKDLLDKDIDLYYKLLVVEDPERYSELVKGYRITDVRD